MKKLLSIFFILCSFRSFAVTPILGDSIVCIGTLSYFNDSTVGGVWSSSDTLIARIDTNGVVTGIASGTAIITYSVDSSITTKAITVYPEPSPIIGPSYTDNFYVCLYGQITVYDTTAGGGYWNVVSPGPTESIIYENSNTAIVSSGENGQWADIIFVDTFGCSTYVSLLTIGEPLPPIVGDTMIYLDLFTTLHCGLGPGGIWSSSDTSIASVNPETGLITGISPGTITITYSFGCIITTPFTVLPPLSVPVFAANPNPLSISPNPATNQLTIASSQNLNQITITNLFGQTIYSNNYTTQKAEINIAGWPNGMYLIKINNSDVRKFLKE